MKRVLAPLAGLLLASCISTSVTPLKSTYHEPTEPENVDVYLTENDVPRPFEKVGLIFATGDSKFTDQKMMITKGKKEAAKLGANGLIVSGIQEASEGAKIASFVFGVATNRHGQMVAIYVYPPTAAEPPAPEPPAEAADKTEANEPATGEAVAQRQSFDQWRQAKTEQASSQQ